MYSKVRYSLTAILSVQTAPLVAQVVDTAALRSFVVETYVDTTSETGINSARNRFKALGGGRVTDLLPDSAFCDLYFALAAGTFCYRAHANEPFQTRRLMALVGPDAKAADSLLLQAVGERYRRVRTIAFLRQSVAAGNLRCASFFVNQILRTLDGATMENFFEAPRGVTLSGIGCRVGKHLLARLDSSSDIGTIELWDSFLWRKRLFLLLQHHGDEISDFEVFAVTPSGLRLVLAYNLWHL